MTYILVLILLILVFIIWPIQGHMEALKNLDFDDENDEEVKVEFYYVCHFCRMIWRTKGNIDKICHKCGKESKVYRKN